MQNIKNSPNVKDSISHLVIEEVLDEKSKSSSLTR